MSDSPYAIAVVKPVVITSAMLVSSDVPETDYAAYASGTTYAVGDRVIITATHKIYESLQAGNTGHAPADSPTWWIEVGPTNRWKCFDGKNASQTITAGGVDPTITYEIEPGKAIPAIGVLNITGATSVEIDLTDPVYGSVYHQTTDLSAVPEAPDWWSWFFAERSAPTQFVITDLPAFPSAVLRVCVSGTTELAVGVILLGQVRRFSEGVYYGARLGIQDYSRQVVNGFGDMVLSDGNYAKRTSMTLCLDYGEIDRFAVFCASVRQTPCLWVCASDLESMTIYGIYKSFEVLVNYITTADCSLDLLGLT